MCKGLKLLTVILVLAVCGVSHGAQPKLDLDAQNPAIQNLQARMTARAQKIEQWKAKGAIGENLTGLAEQRPAASLGLAEKKEVRDLVAAENEDRAALFRELALANGLQEKDLSLVASAYATMKRQAAAPTHWVQNPAGKEWVQKKDLKE